MILRQTTRDGYDVDVPGIAPKLMDTPDSVRSSAPKLGDDTEDIRSEIGLAESCIAELRDKGAIA
jgi:formyl-CoA transferase